MPALLAMGGAPRWRVVVIDGHERTCRALGGAVRAAGGQVVATASTAAEGIALVRSIGPEVAIVGLHPGDGEGFVAAAAIARECCVVLHGGPLDASGLRHACDTGAMAHLARPLQDAAVGPTLALAVARFDEARTLRTRLEERKVVERAKGLLMRREGLTEEEAYRRLRRAAMDSRRPLVTVAREVVHAGPLA